MSTNLEYRERERQRKRESRATGQRSSTRKRARAKEKSKGDFVSRRSNICNGGEKMRNACVNQGENERRERTRTTYFSSIKRVTRPFLEVSRCSRAKKIYKKSVLHVQS